MSEDDFDYDYDPDYRRRQSRTELALHRLLDDYRALQPPIHTRLKAPPTALEALRMVHAAHPTIIYGCNPLTPAGDGLDWDDAETYRRILGDGEVTIAVTDDGYADSVRRLADGFTTFVKPLEEKMAVPDFLDSLCDPEHTEIMYLQSQDGNVYRSEPRSDGDELEGMRGYLQRDVCWMREAIGESADAVNLWIGSSRSVTSLHHDPYENIYHVLSGTKTFTLISPIEGLWLSQKFHPTSTLRRSTSSSALEPIPDPPPAYPVPWVESELFLSPIEPLVVTLHEGDTLYLPSGWWHRVEQTEGAGGLAVAVNYWYNSTLQASSHALFRLAQRTARIAGWEGVVPVDLDESEEEEEEEEDEGEDHDGEDREDGGDLRGGYWGGHTDGRGGSGSESGEEWEPSDWGR